MKQTILLLLLIALSIIGIADSGYVTYEELSGSTPVCTPGFQCASVLDSPYAQIAGFPVSIIGLGFYGLVLLMALLDYSGWGTLPLPILKKDKNHRGIFLALSIAAFAFTIYLVSIMAFVLKAWCLYCLISALTTTSILIVSSIMAASSSKSSFFIKKPLYKLQSLVYRNLIKPIFFLFDAEFVHNSITLVGKSMGQWSVMRFLARSFFGFFHPVLKKEIAGIKISQPIGLAAGFDYNGELTGILPDVGFGWHTIGTVTLQPYEGNKKPRLGRFPESKALLVNKGLKSLGAVAIIQKLENIVFRIPTGISIASTNTYFNSTKDQIKDFLTTFILFEKSKVRHSYYELNISCPNTFGGEPFTSPERLEILLTCLDELSVSKPIFIKMPIDQDWNATKALLDVASNHNIQGLIFGNLTKDHKNPDIHPLDLEKWKEKKGNLSGKPTFNRSNSLIKQTKTEFGSRFALIGTGGIFDSKDAQEKIEAGADALQLITGMIFNGPHTIGSIHCDLANELLEDSTDHIS